MKQKTKEIYTIAELSEVTGLSKDTIKRYQTKGLIPDRRNPVNNYRIFTIEDKDKIIKFLMSGKINA